MIERGLAAERRTLARGGGRPAIRALHRALCRAYRGSLAAVPGLEAALDELAAGGFSLVVCTNKLEWLSFRLLDALGLTQAFRRHLRRRHFGLQKPDPELLRRTIERAGGRADRAVMVGDFANDVDMARAAGIPVIAVDFGYTRDPGRVN